MKGESSKLSVSALTGVKKERAYMGRILTEPVFEKQFATKEDRRRIYENEKTRFS